MHDVELRRLLMDERIETLRRAALRPVGVRAERLLDTAQVELRLCKPADDPALARLAALAERPLPVGRLVVALLDGRIVAALPLGGGPALADPFVRTAQLVRLLELRAAQLHERAPRPGFVPRLLRRHA